MFGFDGWYVPVNYKKTNTITHKMIEQEDRETIFDFQDAKDNTYGLLPEIQFFYAAHGDE